MLAAAARIARGVEVPVTVDAEAGYGMQPADLVAALRSAGVAGCNLEDTDHSAGGLRDPGHHAEWLSAVRQAASADGYRLVINARVDVFLGPFLAGAGPGTQEGLVLGGAPARERLPRGRRRLRVPDPPVGDGRAAPLHLGSQRPGERRAPAAGAVARRAGRRRRGPRELGNLPAPGRDGPVRRNSSPRSRSDGGARRARRRPPRPGAPSGALCAS